MKNSSKIKSFVERLLDALPPRQRKILRGRYGLDGKPALTLAELGENYGITRERVRQIEALALVNVRFRLVKGGAGKFVESALGHLRRFGGVRKEELLLKDLNCSRDDAPRVSFLLEASGKGRHSKEDQDFNSHWYLSPKDKDRAVDFVNRLKTLFRNNKEKILEGENLDKLNLPLPDNVVAHYVSLSKAFRRNVFGDFGLSEWSEVFPKNVREWAHLILKKVKKPLHFSKITEEIQKHRANTVTNTQTVHNELIKDERFVLVGRGIYTLREFGVLPGTAREIIAQLLKNHGPMKSQELINQILQERTFKENTILVNLQNKQYFRRLEDGRYTIREA